LIRSKSEKLVHFGFAFPDGSPHVSRTYMLSELTLLLDYENNDEATRAQYIEAIVTDNCLGKRTDKK